MFYNIIKQFRNLKFKIYFEVILAINKIDTSLVISFIYNVIILHIINNLINLNN